MHSSPGVEVKLHKHPYPEVFIIQSGQATFRIEDSEITATAGQILVAPAGAPHGVTNTAAGRLGLTAIHPVTEMQTEWLE